LLNLLGNIDRLSFFVKVDFTDICTKQLFESDLIVLVFIKQRRNVLCPVGLVDGRHSLVKCLFDLVVKLVAWEEVKASFESGFDEFESLV
jgi:hypothetical protein